MNTAKEARRDAEEYARAEMYYGEGAGVRRKLIQATVEGKAYRDPAYGREFHKELERQDMADHAAKARREREIKDKKTSLEKNFRGLATGNRQSLSTGVMVVAAIGVFAHQTGLDQKAYEKGQDLIRKAKAWNERRKVRKAIDDLRRPPSRSA